MDDVKVANTFFTILTLLANAAVVIAIVLALLALVSTRARRFGAAVLDAVGPSARATAALVAIVATLGSLYYSEIANFVPCRLCWYQRICMYPLAVILLVGVLRRDRGVRWYAATVCDRGRTARAVPLARRAGRMVRREQLLLR